MCKLVVELAGVREGERYSSLIDYELQSAVELIDTHVEIIEECSVEAGDKITIDISTTDVLDDLRDILHEVWSRPIVLAELHDDNESTAVVESLGAIAVRHLERIVLNPVEYDMGDGRYDDMSIQFILEDGLTEYQFKEHFARANKLCATYAMQNIQDAKEKLNEVLRIAR